MTLPTPPTSALARERRAQTGNAWGVPAIAGGGGGAAAAAEEPDDSPDFPRLVITRDTPSQVRVGSTVDVLLTTTTTTTTTTTGGGDATEAAPVRPKAFARGVVAAITDAAAEGLPAMARVLLEWRLADGSPATLYTPITALAVASRNSSSTTTASSTTTTEAIDADANHADVDTAARNLKSVRFFSGEDSTAAASSVEAASTAPPPQQQSVEKKKPPQQQQAKSRILPSAGGGGLSSTELVNGDGGLDDDDWVTPDNLGSYVGQEGFTKAFQTVSAVVALACLHGVLCVRACVL